MWGEFQLPPYIEGAVGGTVGSDFRSPDMGWGEGWGAPLELALGLVASMTRDVRVVLRNLPEMCFICGSNS